MKAVIPSSLDKSSLKIPKDCAEKSHLNKKSLLKNRKTILFKMHGNKMPLHSFSKEKDDSNSTLQAKMKPALNIDSKKDHFQTRDVGIGPETNHSENRETSTGSKSVAKKLEERKLSKFCQAMKDAGYKNKIFPAERINNTFKKFKQILKSRSVLRTRVKDIENQSFHRSTYQSVTAKPPNSFLPNHRLLPQRHAPLERPSMIQNRHYSVDNTQESVKNMEEERIGPINHYLKNVNHKLPINEIRRELVKRLIHNTDYKRDDSDINPTNEYGFVLDLKKNYFRHKNSISGDNSSDYSQRPLPSNSKSTSKTRSKSCFFKYTPSKILKRASTHVLSPSPAPSPSRLPFQNNHLKFAQQPE
ncbi:unnamed protein product [Moneuplotes crassus]|uniref:Uncharacterized protein n=1 Tax=Euplotes crassus TaxID=5936 RepID=A0AAD1U834_EUPCR|nr:unnamed protein product [Moneuplotes crassus]